MSQKENQEKETYQFPDSLQEAWEEELHRLKNELKRKKEAKKGPMSD